MNYLLDTCSVSALRGTVPVSVREWFESRDPDCFYVSVVTLAEIEDGIERLAESKKKRDLREWFSGPFRSQFTKRFLPINEDVAIAWGKLNARLIQKGCNIYAQDLYLAATAEVFRLEIVTINIKDFKPTGLSIVNPWQY